MRLRRNPISIALPFHKQPASQGKTRLSIRAILVLQELDCPRNLHDRKNRMEASTHKVNLDDNFANAILQSSHPATPTLYHERQPATTVGPSVPALSQCGCTNSHLDLLQSLFKMRLTYAGWQKKSRLGRSISDGHVMILQQVTLCILTWLMSHQSILNTMLWDCVVQ